MRQQRPAVPGCARTAPRPGPAPDWYVIEVVHLNGDHVDLLFGDGPYRETDRPVAPPFD